MSSQHIKPSSFRQIIIAVIAAAFLLALLFVLPEATKYVGATLLFIPEQLGLIERVSREEIQRVSLLEAQPTIMLNQAGRYTVYSGDMNLLSAKVKAQEPWLIVRLQSTGKKASVHLIERGLRPYDSPIVKGRPMFVFDAPEPGVYEITNRLVKIGTESPGSFKLLNWSRDESGVISVVPDYTSGKETVITIAFVVEIGLIAGPLGFLCLKRYVQRRRTWKAIQDKKRRQGDAFWQTMKQENRQGKEES